MEVTPYLFSELFRNGAEIGALSALIKSGQVKPYLNKSEAFKKYGRSNIEQWLKDDLIKMIKDGDQSSAWRLDKIELEIADKSLKILKLWQQAEYECQAINHTR